MSDDVRIRYRKLPGHRRGFIRGASVWLGPDHLLSVKSMRFREEYRRFYFRDVQAIAIAKAPRFHISTRVVPVVLMVPVLFGSLVAIRNVFPLFWPVFWIVAALLLAAWVMVSSLFSCRCRIYTAVSGEELPSVYRTWTARRFLAKVEPLIRQAQGAVEGNWAEAVEDRGMGPVQTVDSSAPPEAPAAQEGARGSVAAMCFALALLGSSAFDFATLQSHAPWPTVLPLYFAVVKMAAATAVFVQYARGQATLAVRRLAIAELIALGILVYANQFRASIAAANPKNRTVTISTVVLGGSPVLRGIEGGVDLVLGMAAAVLTMAASKEA